MLIVPIHTPNVIAFFYPVEKRLCHCISFHQQFVKNAVQSLRLPGCILDAVCLTQNCLNNKLYRWGWLCTIKDTLHLKAIHGVAPGCILDRWKQPRVKNSEKVQPEGERSSAPPPPPTATPPPTCPITEQSGTDCQFRMQRCNHRGAALVDAVFWGQLLHRWLGLILKLSSTLCP